LILNQNLDWIYLGFIFLSTIFIYSIHRIIGINKLKDEKSSGRFKIIYTYRKHIIAYSIFSIIGLIILIPFLNPNYLLHLFGVGIISVGYTLPIFSKKRRLRDFNYIKIILIALVWAYLCIIPFLSAGNYHWPILLIDFIEKFVFIFAITLPFDIRDNSIDRKSNLKTLPQILGIELTIKIIYSLLLIGFLLLCFKLFLYNVEIIQSLLLSSTIYSMTFICIRHALNKSSDYYYSGLIDGTLIFRGFLVFILFL